MIKYFVLIKKMNNTRAITYCLSCKKDTKNIDPKVIKTKNNKRASDTIKMFHLQ